MIRMYGVTTRAGLIAMVLLSILGLTATPGEAAPPAPGAPGAKAAPAAPASNPLLSDTNNSAILDTTFTNSNASWKFVTNASNSKAITATCNNGSNCLGLSATASGTGVYGTASNQAASSLYGVRGDATNSADNGTTYGGYFTSSNVAVGGISYGVYGGGETAGGYLYSGNGTGAVGKSTNGLGVYGVSTNAAGVRGESTFYYGVYGQGEDAGVYGYGIQGGVRGLGSAYGVYGSSPLISGGAGVRGEVNGTLSYGGIFTNPVGTALQTSSSSGYGIYSSSSSGYGLVGVSASSVGVRAISTSNTGLFANSSTGYGASVRTTSGFTALRASNNITDSAHYAIVADGNVLVNGTLHAAGGISAPLVTSQGTRLVYAEESTTNRYSDQGSAQLVNGRAVIKIDPLFAEAVDLSGDYQVFVTANTFDTAGLAVGNKTATSFEVRELNKGQGNFKIDWRLSAPRKGYATQRLGPAPPAPPAEAPLP